MEDLLFYKYLCDPIEGNLTRPKDKNDKVWERMNKKSIGLIQ